MLGDDDGVMSLAKWRFDNWGTLNELSADDFGNLEIISDHKVKLEVSLDGFPADGVIDHWIKLGFNINGTCENDSGGCCYDEYIDSVPTTVVYQSDYDEPDCTNENGIERREIRKRVHVKRRVSIRSELKRAQRTLEAKNGTAKRRSLQ
jgi:hypothetical protein